MGIKVGIDLGTTNTVVARVYENGPHVCPQNAPDLIPSVVDYSEAGVSGRPRVGAAADQARSGVIRSVKRLMGRTFDEAHEQETNADCAFEYLGPERFRSRGEWLIRRDGTDLLIRVECGNEQRRDVRPAEVSAEILRKAVQVVRDEVGDDVEAVTITVPAYFTDAHRAATRQAAEEAGIVSSVLLDEPTAAAVAFGRVVAIPDGAPLLVVDWGGGTLDVTLVSFVGGAWVQHGHDGDLNCGGDNIDHDLAVHVLQQEGHSTDLLAEPFLYHALVRRAARATKEALSAGRPGTFNLIVPLEGKAVPFRRVVTREAFIKIVGRHVRHCRSIVERCLSTVGWAVSDIKHVLLVGGSTRLPELHHELRQMLPVAVFHDDVDPMHAVALGAATYAEGLTEVAATCAYGYGIVVGGTHREVVPPNEYVPTPQAMFREVTPKPRTAYDGQTIYRCELVAFTEQREFLRIGKGSRRALRQGRYATCACRHRGFSSPLAR